jgi:predicted oxidoreductase
VLCRSVVGGTAVLVGALVELRGKELVDQVAMGGLASIGADTVTLVDVLGGTERLLTEVDSVVIRTHGVPVDELYHELKAAGENVVRVGDAVAVRYCDRAIYDGHTAGRAI